MFNTWNDVLKLHSAILSKCRLCSYYAWRIVESNFAHGQLIHAQNKYISINYLLFNNYHNQRMHYHHRADTSTARSIHYTYQRTSCRYPNKVWTQIRIESY